MRSRSYLLTLFALICATTVFADVDIPQRTPIATSITSAPLAFAKNQGQWPDSILFRADAGDATMWFTYDGIYYRFTRRIERPENRSDDDRIGLPHDRIDRVPDSLETMLIKATFVGSNPNATVHGEGELEYKCNYFLGNDSTKWATDVPNYSSIVIEDFYPGVNMRYAGDGTGGALYELESKSDADLSQVQVRYEGAEGTFLDDDGKLVARTKWGDEVVLIGGQMSPSGIASAKVHMSAETEGGADLSAAGGGKASSSAVELVYSTYLSGSDRDEGYAITVDNSGCAYITGETLSDNFPTEGAFQPVIVVYDVFVTKLNPAGDGLVYSTFLGGDGLDVGNDIVVDEFGNVYITGYTTSSSFPTTAGAYQTSQVWNYEYDVFVTKLNALGNDLIYSTYVAEDGDEFGYGIAVDASGAAYITGQTNSNNFATSGAFETTRQGNYDAFVAKINPSGGDLVYSTYLGGSDVDYGYGIALDDLGNAYIAGQTGNYGDFPTVGAYQGVHQGGYDAFVTKLNSYGNDLVYSTYLGGDGFDKCYDITVDGLGNAYVAGYTLSTNFPVVEGYQTDQGGCDGFVTKLNPAGNGLIYSTYLGGSDVDECFGIGVDGVGNAYVTGYTQSTNFPNEGEYQTDQGAGDAFVTKLNSSGNNLVFSTYLGGDSLDQGNDIAVDITGAVYVTGETKSIDFPILNAHQGTNQGGMDAFVTKLSHYSPIVPVVLVHGWNSGDQVWGDDSEGMVKWLHDAGREYVWKVDLDECGHFSEYGWQSNHSRMYRGNAILLHNFIVDRYNALSPEERSRISEIDIVAHSMGGLVSRRYMAQYPGDPWTPLPVRYLVMLGTPNLGSGLAGFKADLICPGPAAYELEQSSMIIFNQTFSRPEYTSAYSIWGYKGCNLVGVSSLFCKFSVGGLLGCPNDGVVTAASAVGRYTIGDLYPNHFGVDLCHGDYQGDQALFDIVVLPLLSGSTPEQTAPSRQQFEDIPAQKTYETLDSTGQGSYTTGLFLMEANSVSLTYAWLSDAVATFSLNSPSGITYDSNSTTTDSSVIFVNDQNGLQGFIIESAEPGIWQWTVDAENASASPVKFVIEGTCKNDVRVVGTQNYENLSEGDTLILNISVIDGGTGISGLTVEAIPIRNCRDTANAISLIDDGSSGDELAGDGVYGIRLVDVGSGLTEYKISVSGPTPSGAINRIVSLYAYSTVEFLCGDIDNSGNVNVADLTYLVAYIFQGGSPPPHPSVADVDSSGAINVSDLTYLVAFLFQGGPAPTPCQ